MLWPFVTPGCLDVAVARAWQTTARDAAILGKETASVKDPGIGSWGGADRDPVRLPRVPLRLASTTTALSPWALLPVGDPVVVCLVRSTFRASVRSLPRHIVGCVLPEDHEVGSTHPVR